MVSDRWQRVQEIFHQALERPPEDRAEFARAEAGDDPSLTDEILALLQSADSSGSYLDDLARRVGVSPPSSDALSGKMVGSYRLERLIGRGGMGAVYLAERADEQFEKNVAVKLLPMGLLTEENRRRFLFERQILAGLEHPNIARLLDGGVLEDGTPYFVMEHVEGRPIDRYCDDNRLPIDQRLRLFRTVCEAVQYAHQNLVVHRDIKPGNVLVTEEGTVKLLDFGIARVVSEETGAEPSTLTMEARPLTPAFASPEQVRREPVTTVADVYALGGLLYVLLAGRPPLDLAGTPPAEVEKAICERDPEPPSRGFRAGTPAAVEAAAARGTTPERLAKALRGDLDTIALTALRKEPGHRYASARDLAEDVRRFQSRQPITARASSVGYRFRRFLARHSLAVGLTAAAVVLLVALASFHALRLSRERDQTRRQRDRAEQVASYLLSLFEYADPTVEGGPDLTAREILQRSVPRMRGELEGQPDVEASVLLVVASVYRTLGMYDEALPLAEEALTIRTGLHGEEDAEVAECLDLIGLLRGELGDLETGREELEKSLAMKRQLLGERHLGVAATLDALGWVVQELSDFPAAESLYVEALSIRRERLGPEHLDVAESMGGLAIQYELAGRFDVAESMLKQVLDLRKRLQGEEHVEYAGSALAFAQLLQTQGRPAEAEPLLRQALSVFERTYGHEHARVLDCMNQLGRSLFRQGHYAEAESLLTADIDIRSDVFGEVHPSTARALNDLAVLYREREDYASAEPLYRRALEIYLQLLGDEHAAVGITKFNLASVVSRMGQYDEAESLFRDAEALYIKNFGEESTWVQNARLGIAQVFHLRGDRARAEPMYRDVLAGYRETLPPDHPKLAYPLDRLGRLLAEQSRYSEAEPLLREALGRFVEGHGEDHLFTARAAIWLAASLAGLGRHAEAESLLAKGLSTERAHLDDDHRLVVEAFRVAADFYEDWGKAEQASEYRRLLALQK